MDARRSRVISCPKLGLDFGMFSKISASKTFSMWIRIRSLSMSTAIIISNSEVRQAFMMGFGRRAVSAQWKYSALVVSYSRKDRPSPDYPRTQSRLAILLTPERSGDQDTNHSNAASAIQFVYLPERSVFARMRRGAHSYLTEQRHRMRYQGIHRLCET
jgi:hypothetical protein